MKRMLDLGADTGLGLLDRQQQQWNGVLPTLLRRRCATLVGENITYQPEDEENSP